MIEPVERDGHVAELEITAEDSAGKSHRYGARNLVIAPSSHPRLPDICDHLVGDQRIIHSSNYMDKLVPNLRIGERIAIIGAGQSAAEIFADLAFRTEMPQLSMIMCAHAMRPSDDSLFVNEIFSPEQTDSFHALPGDQQKATLCALSSTNYAVVDQDLINSIYTILYEQNVTSSRRLTLLSRTNLTGLRAAGDQLELVLENMQGVCVEQFDRVVFATGYCRALNERVLHGIAPYLSEPQSRRDYRLNMAHGFAPAVFV